MMSNDSESILERIERRLIDINACLKREERVRKIKDGSIYLTDISKGCHSPAMYKNNIYYLKDLKKYTLKQILNIRGIGEKVRNGLNEVLLVADRYGIYVWREDKL
jgi:hypothetical protein